MVQPQSSESNTLTVENGPTTPSSTAAATVASGMPENAHRELAPGEVYVPLVPDESPPHEVTTRSIIFGIANAVFWSAAVSYLTLKLGQGLEAAIPIAILAIGLSALCKRRSSYLENVNIMAFGATSGIVVGGTLFVMPAIHILGLQSLSSFFQIFFVPLLGAALGVLFLIPLRRYFVRDMHGKLPFPEGTATAEVLVTGQKGGSQAGVLLKAMGVGFVFDSLTILLGAWHENFSTASLSLFRVVTTKFKAVFALNTTAAIAGLGYLIGLRYAAYIMAGSMLSYFVIVPLFAFFGQYVHEPIGMSLPPLGEMDHEALFYEYARYIGIGGIFVAGVVSVIKMLPVMVQAFTSGIRGVLAGRHAGHEAKVPRTERDIPMPVVLALLAVVIAAMWVYFRIAVLASQRSPSLMATLAVVIAVVIALLFAAVSSWAVAMISVTPISGMTLMTLIVGAVLLKHIGLSGREGMLAVLLIGGVVCTCLSMTGSLVTEFKVAYWLGATPRKVQWSNFAGAIVSSIVVTAVMLLLAQVYGFDKSPAHPTPLPAPQANAMAGVLGFLMETDDLTKWYLLGFGGVIALVIEMLGISSLAFALGMYIPMEYNSPLLLGALVNYFVHRSAKKDPLLARARGDRGILIASGLIAGGALAGVVAALVKFLESDVVHREMPRLDFTKLETDWPHWLGLGMFVAICVGMYLAARRARREDAGPRLEA